ncbi:hypothetical protein [Amycolatopsis sp. NPDC004378]
MLMDHFEISAPLDTHWRVRSCAEEQCPAHVNGWKSYFDENLDLGRRQAAYVRTTAGRRFTERRTEEGLTEFTFEPGQDCFSTVVHQGRPQHGHLAPIGRPELFVVRGDDGALTQHSGPDAWTDHLHTKTTALARQING